VVVVGGDGSGVVVVGGKGGGVQVVGGKCGGVGVVDGDGVGGGETSANNSTAVAAVTTEMRLRFIVVVLTTTTCFGYNCRPDKNDCNTHTCTLAAKKFCPRLTLSGAPDAALKQFNYRNFNINVSVKFPGYHFQCYNMS
jgi:hypothetical protein